MRHEFIIVMIIEDHLNVLYGEHSDVTTKVKEWNSKQFLIVLIN